MAKVRPDQCRFCGSRRCYDRIHTDDYQFDEVACRDHSRDLEIYSDAKLGKKLRWFISGTGLQRRGVKESAIAVVSTGEVASG